MSVILYSKPGCGPCIATERALRSKGLVAWTEDLPAGVATYEKIDVTQDDEARAFVTDTLGYRQMPVVYLDAENHWSGFDEKRINQLIAGRDPIA